MVFFATKRPAEMRQRTARRKRESLWQPGCREAWVGPSERYTPGAASLVLKPGDPRIGKEEAGKAVLSSGQEFVADGAYRRTPPTVASAT